MKLSASIHLINNNGARAVKDPAGQGLLLNHHLFNLFFLSFSWRGWRIAPPRTGKYVICKWWSEIQNTFAEKIPSCSLIVSAKTVNISNWDDQLAIVPTLMSEPSGAPILMHCCPHSRIPAHPGIRSINAVSDPGWAISSAMLSLR